MCGNASGMLAEQRSKEAIRLRMTNLDPPCVSSLVNKHFCQKHEGSNNPMENHAITQIDWKLRSLQAYFGQKGPGQNHTD